MWEKKVMHAFVAAQLKTGRVEVTDWDGRVWQYDKKDSTEMPWLHVRVEDPCVVRAMLRSPNLAVGEAYMNGHLVIPEAELAEFFTLIARNAPSKSLRSPFRSSNRKHAQRSNIAAHYDVGNDYYDLWLDEETRLYSCAYFSNPEFTLEEAQKAKVRHLLRKLRLKKGQRLLDIGCGWGYLAIAAAKEYGVHVLGITLSSEQLKGARARAEREGVAHLVEFELINYQDLEGEFDRIVSVGMFEHVGKQYYTKFFNSLSRLLTPDGVAVLHTITQQYPRPVDAWVDKYIFPGGYLPTVCEITTASQGAALWLTDFEDLCQHYARTLELWRERHQTHRDTITQMYDQRFYRMRDFWLVGSWAAFRYGRLGLGQFVFTKGKPGDLLTRDHVYSS